MALTNWSTSVVIVVVVVIILVVFASCVSVYFAEQESFRAFMSINISAC